MTFRVRLFIAFAATAVIPLAILAAGVAHELDQRLTEADRQRAAGLGAQTMQDVANAGAAVAERLAAVRDGLVDDNRFREAVVHGAVAERPYLLDYAARAMRLSGLAMLQIENDSGRILSSGHYRNEYDRNDSGLLAAVAKAPGGAALMWARTPAGPMLVLARADSVRLGGQWFVVVGGVEASPNRLSHPLSESELSLSLTVAPPVAAAPIEMGGAARSAELCVWRRSGFRPLLRWRMGGACCHRDGSTSCKPLAQFAPFALRSCGGALRSPPSRLSRPWAPPRGWPSAFAADTTARGAVGVDRSGVAHTELLERSRRRDWGSRPRARDNGAASAGGIRPAGCRAARGGRGSRAPGDPRREERVGPNPPCRPASHRSAARAARAAGDGLRRAPCDARCQHRVPRCAGAELRPPEPRHRRWAVRHQRDRGDGCRRIHDSRRPRRPSRWYSTRGFRRFTRMHSSCAAFSRTWCRTPAMRRVIRPAA